MNKKLVFKSMGGILIVEALLMLLPLTVSLIEKDNKYLSFIIPSLIMIVLGLTLFLIFKNDKSHVSSKEGFVIVGLAWIVLSLFGCLPYIISGEIDNFIDALFETVSGYTTTGASILSGDEIDLMSRSLLFYRSLTHFIGGMGVLVLVLVILPQSQAQNIFFLKAESTGPNVSKMTSKIKSTATILYLIYVALTLIEIILLFCDPKNDLFTSITFSFSTAGTGGFAIFKTSAATLSHYSQIVITIFMALFGINFNIFFFILIGKITKIFKNEEFIAYISILVLSTIIITINLLINSKFEFSDALRHSAFQAVSFMTSTGFSSTDYLTWDMMSKGILFILMFIGACSGSTGGGLKVSRIVILFKSLKREIGRIVHPKRIESIRLDGEVLPQEVEKGVLSYFSTIMIFIAVSFIIVSTSGNDFETNLSCTVSAINNVGLAFGKSFEACGSFNIFNVPSKIVLIILMLIGRLELYPVLIIFNYKIWKNN